MNKVCVENGNKRCSRCQLLKAANDFYKTKTAAAGLQSHCKSCARAYDKKHYVEVLSKDAKWKAGQRARARLVKYGVSQEAFDTMLKEQDSKCKVCRTSEPGTKGWALDHNHTTNVVRGVLCQACNKLLGFAKDNPAVLREAANYLDKSIAMAARV